VSFKFNTNLFRFCDVMAAGAPYHALSPASPEGGGAVKEGGVKMMIGGGGGGGMGKKMGLQRQR
jgi:hypothetical protein